MAVEIYALPQQPDAFDPASQSLIVSNRASVDGTGFRTVQEVFTATLANLAQPIKASSLDTNAAGTVSAPVLRLNADTNSGFYHIGNNNWGLAMNGVKVADVQETSITFGVASGTYGGVRLYGVQDASAATAGTVGERVKQTGAAASVGATGVATTIATLALTKGSWDVAAQVVVHGGATGLTANSTIKASIVTTTNTNGTSGTTMVQESVLALLANGLFTLALPKLDIDISANTSYYLTLEVTYAAGTPTVDFSATATRIR